jgi:hypothetical protein
MLCPTCRCAPRLLCTKRSSRLFGLYPQRVRLRLSISLQEGMEEGQISQVLEALAASEPTNCNRAYRCVPTVPTCLCTCVSAGGYGRGPDLSGSRSARSIRAHHPGPPCHPRPTRPPATPHLEAAHATARQQQDRADDPAHCSKGSSAAGAGSSWVGAGVGVDGAAAGLAAALRAAS